MVAPPPTALGSAVAFAAHEFALRRRGASGALDGAVAWRELVACVVGGGTRYELALSATDVICELIPEPWSISSREWQNVRVRLASASLRLPTRFPNQHGRYLVSAVDRLYRDGDGLLAMLTTNEPETLRRQLVATLLGVGPKQASLFLSNMGLTDDMAVLDRHVLRYLAWVGLLPSERPPRSLTEYEAVERTFRAHATAFGHAVIDLDAAVWLTSRVWSQVAQ